MKKIIFIALALMLFQNTLGVADDGGSWYPEDWTYGNIYVKEPSALIALEKELMIVEQSYRSEWENEELKTRRKVHGSEVEAIFGFKNTSSQNVVVPCAFPVVVSTHVAVRKDGLLSNYIEVGNGYSSRLEVLEAALGKKLKFKEGDWESGERRWGTTDATKNDLLSVDKKLRTVSIAEYLSELKNYKAKETLYPCQIVQDGKKVLVQTVGIETSIEKHEEYTEFLKEKSWTDQVEVYTIKVVLHFFHELAFKPNASSTLSVKYTVDAYKGGRSYLHEFIYDISTGGTWKGDIKSFVVLTDSSMDIKNSKTKFEITKLGKICNHTGTYLYCAENYKPQKDEYFLFKYDDSDFWECESLIFNRDGVQDFVSGVCASSQLSGSYKISQDTGGCLDRELVPSTYEAKTSFDGNLLNGWVEGAKGEGIGEWIEFTLSKAALGPFATNGLRRFGGRGEEAEYYDSYDFDYGKDYSVYIKAGGVQKTWESNNRVKSMHLSSEDKNIAELQFEDKCTQLFANPPDWLTQNTVKNPQLLKKGTYRMTINSVYKGKKWDDTVLGEVWFVPIEDNAAKAILTDDFFKAPIMQKINLFLKK